MNGYGSDGVHKLCQPPCHGGENKAWPVVIGNSFYSLFVGVF
jgi:hypothetical protein